MISRWHAESCVEVFALRADHPLVTLDEREHGEQWRAIVVADDDRASQPSSGRLHLIRYEELREAGILQWITLRDEFARALDPVISSIELRGATANALLAQAGPGLEALGYLLMLRDGVTERNAARASLQVRFERVLESVGDTLPFDGPTWASNTIAAYNGLKHANRAQPDEVDVLNAWRESVVVARAWIATELGVPSEKAKDRLARDPQRSPYIKRE